MVWVEGRGWGKIEKLKIDVRWRKNEGKKMMGKWDGIGRGGSE